MEVLWVGFAQVDIDVKQNNASGYGTYPDKTLDAWTYALGYKVGFGDNGIIKVEGFGGKDIRVPIANFEEDFARELKLLRILKHENVIDI